MTYYKLTTWSHHTTYLACTWPSRTRCKKGIFSFWSSRSGRLTIEAMLSTIGLMTLASGSCSFHHHETNPHLFPVIFTRVWSVLTYIQNCFSKWCSHIQKLTIFLNWPQSNNNILQYLHRCSHSGSPHIHQVTFLVVNPIVWQLPSLGTGTHPQWQTACTFRQLLSF